MKILNKILSASVALALAASFIACSNEVSGGDSVHTNFSKAAVSGVVTEYVSVDNSNAVVKGLEGARVTMGKYSATTDSNGVWTITGVEPGKYVAYVSKSGYSEAKTSTEITVDAKTYEDLKLASANALKEELLKTIANLGVVNPATGAGLSSAGQLGGTIEGETAVANGTAVETVGQSYTIDKDLLRWFDTNVAAYDYEYAIVADAMVITPLTGILKGTVKLRPTNGAKDEINVADKVAGANVKVSVYNSTKSTLYGTATTNNEGKFTVKNLPAYAVVGTDVKVTLEPFKEGNLVYGTVDAKGMTAATLLPNVEIDAQDFCFAAVLEEDCVNVVETNIGNKTQETAVSLNTPITFTFDRAIESIAFKSGTNFVENENYKVSFSDDKKTVTLTPIPSIWEFTGDVEISSLVTEDGYNQDALVQKKFSVKFVDGPYMVAFNNADVTRIFNTKTIEVNKSEPIVVEFDKEIDYVSAIKLSSGAGVDGNYKVTDPEIVVDGKKVTINPKKTADGKAEFTETYLELKVVAKDKTSGTAKVSSISYATFKALNYEIVEQSAIPTTARAVAVTATQALKITFNGAVKEVKNATVAGKPAVAKVDGNVVYILFNDFVNTEAESAVKADVYPVVGDKATVDTDSIKYQAEATYEIVSANWGGKGKSVNGSKNDSVVTTDKLAVTDSIVLTFNKDFAEGSTVTAELYKKADVANSVTTASYATTATVAGKVVTIKPTVALEKNTEYAVAFSVAKDGVTAFTTKRGVTVAADYTSIKDDLTVDTNVQATYIVFATKADPKLKAGVNDKTTEAAYAASKKILPTESVVLEFDDSVAGYNFLVSSAEISVANKEKTRAEFVATGDYLDNVVNATVSKDATNKVVTVTPAGVLSASKIYIFCYDEKDKFVGTTSVTVDAGKAIKAAIAAEAKLPALVLDTKVKTNIGRNDTTVSFTLDSSAIGVSGVNYEAYKSVINKYGLYEDYVKASDTAGSLSETAVLRGEKTVKPVATKVVTDMTYGAVKYVVLASYKGIYYVTPVYTVEDKVAPSYVNALPAVLTGTSVTVAAFKAEVVTSKTYNLKADEPIKAVNVTCPTGANTVNATATLTGDDTFDLSITGADNAVAGNKITVTITDFNGNQKEVVINIQ